MKAQNQLGPIKDHMKQYDREILMLFYYKFKCNTILPYFATAFANTPL